MSDIDEQERPTIKVTDRRLFDAEGNLRDHVPAPAPGQPDDAPSPPDDSPVDTSPAAAPDRRQEPESPEPLHADDAEPLELADEALMRFLEEQYIGGMLALGAMPEPQSGQLMEDLDLAHVRIEVLTLIQERTSGARSPEASKALEDVLYQLRMVYLQKRKVVKL